MAPSIQDTRYREINDGEAVTLHIVKAAKSRAYSNSFDALIVRFCYRQAESCRAFDINFAIECFYNIRLVSNHREQQKNITLELLCNRFSRRFIGHFSMYLCAKHNH